MLRFDERGSLKPYDLIPSSIEVMGKYFVADIESETRKINFEKYLQYSADLKRHAGGSDLKQWVNGSFTTRKVNPKDIDVVTFLSLQQIKKLGLRIHDFKMDSARLLYGVDAYLVEVYGQESPYHRYTIGNVAYWKDFFTTTRKNRTGKKHKKGFLEIIY